MVGGRPIHYGNLRLVARFFNYGRTRKPEVIRFQLDFGRQAGIGSLFGSESMECEVMGGKVWRQGPNRTGQF